MDAARPTPPLDAGLWTGHDGCVHIRNAGTGTTFCGQPVGNYGTQPTHACDDCVAVSLREYARIHACDLMCRKRAES